MLFEQLLINPHGLCGINPQKNGSAKNPKYIGIILNSLPIKTAQPLSEVGIVIVELMNAH